tara:strand:- start:241 stop:693 length:453 start_codon:yes stop_codon:yes gene_type:complete
MVKKRISNADVFKQIARMSVMGKRQREPYKKVKLNKQEQKNFENGKITMDDYIIMTAYAKVLPQGKRQLKLNMPVLRDMLVATQLKKEPQTITSGLSRGGLMSQTLNVKPLTQKSYHTTIKNNNRVKTLEYPYLNPSYPSFANKGIGVLK